MGLSVSKLFSRLFTPREMIVLMAGLDGVGKTTILYKLKLGEIVTTVPTTNFEVEKIEHKNINFIIWDVGGRDEVRYTWRHYIPFAQMIIFVIDSNDRERVTKAREELQRILNEWKLQRMLNESELQDTLLLVFANKQDLPNAMNATEITDKLGLHDLRRTTWHVQAGCATSGEGLYECLDWLRANFNQRVG